MNASNDQDQADQLGFEQFAHSLAQHLRHTPLGWLVVLALSWHYVSPPRVLAWIAAFTLFWLPMIWLAHATHRRGPVLARDRHRLRLVAALDGLAWGTMPWVLAGVNPMLDAWLITLLSGLAALSAVVYLTELKAFRLYLGAIWLGLFTCLLARQVPEWRLVAAATLFCLLLLRLLKPVSERLAQGRLHEIRSERLAARLSESLARKELEAATDALTGLPNRRSLDALLQSWLGGPHPRQLVLLMLDIDHFKHINDQHGHPVGDAALRAFAERLRGQLRDGDHCARYGGEEFAVLLPGATVERAHDIAERLRQAVAAQPLLERPRVANTVSVGISMAQDHDRPADLLARADAALYRAKQEGRNRVCSA